jgi:hypothetical protein
LLHAFNAAARMHYRYYTHAHAICGAIHFAVTVLAKCKAYKQEKMYYHFVVTVLRFSGHKQTIWAVQLVQDWTN